MAAQGGIADILLVNLAEDIETGEHMEALGRALGFKAATINRYTETNNKGDRVTCKGTRDMLLDWRQTVEPNDQHSKLKQALKEANLIMLSQNYDKAPTNVPDIANKKISESLNVLQCRKNLEKVYLNTLCKIKMKPWDPNDYATLNEMHTRVTMVKKDAHGTDTVEKEILHGSVAEIFSRKVNNLLPDRILLSAAAGRGKTTAVAKMAYDWTHRTKGSGLEELPLLFVLPLRNTGQYTLLGEAIKSQLLSDVDDLSPEALENFIKRNQNICHIIFDGLDEYAGIGSSKRGSGGNIVRIMRYEEYLECRVLVTTRPHLENFFNERNLPMVYTKMGIEGFSQEGIKEYIDKFFTINSDVSKAQSLKLYLDGKPLINELVITPLFCLMVCHLWSEGLLTPDIATQTNLLDSVNLFLLQHANARTNQRSIITDIEFKTLISKLGKVALAGLLSDAKKLVFTPHDFRKVPTILDSACNLGIISKTNVVPARLPQSHDTAYTTIEFYHKLAQEHSAGKYLAGKTKKYLVQIHMSKLDRVLRKIKGHIGDYENLIRFAAGTDNTLCFEIMKAILTNRSFDESERYRILLDCSSETSPGIEGNVSSLVERCVTSQTIVLKSPTVFTVVGMQNLPEELKTQVGEVKFEGSIITADVTNGLWSCLGSFSKLETLNLTDSSLSFPSSPPELPSVTKLTAERLTSQSYEGLLSSLPGLKEIDITIDDGDRDISQIMAGLQRTGREQLTHIRLQPLPSQGKRSGCGSINYKKATQSSNLEIKDCLLSAEMTDRLWSYFRSVTTLHHLIISDSSLRFPPSPPELPSVTKLTAERLTSQSYEGLLLSLPGLEEIDITIDDAEKDISQITAGLQRTGGEQLTRINLSAPSSLPSEKKEVSRETMRGLGLLIKEQTKNLHWIHVSGLQCRDEEDLVDLADSYMNRHVLLWWGTEEDGGQKSHLMGLYTSSGEFKVQIIQDSELVIKECQLSTEMTDKLWSYLRSFTTLPHLIISDSSLSFPSSPPELPYVTKLKAERVTSQSYEGLLSSLPGLKVIVITIDNAESDIDQMTACLQRTGREQLTRIITYHYRHKGQGVDVHL